MAEVRRPRSARIPRRLAAICTASLQGRWRGSTENVSATGAAIVSAVAVEARTRLWVIFRARPGGTEPLEAVVRWTRPGERRTFGIQLDGDPSSARLLLAAGARIAPGIFVPEGGEPVVARAQGPHEPSPMAPSREPRRQRRSSAAHPIRRDSPGPVRRRSQGGAAGLHVRRLRPGRRPPLARRPHRGNGALDGHHAPRRSAGASGGQRGLVTAGRRRARAMPPRQAFASNTRTSGSSGSCSIASGRPAAASSAFADAPELRSNAAAAARGTERDPTRPQIHACPELDARGPRLAFSLSLSLKRRWAMPLTTQTFLSAATIVLCLTGAPRTASGAAPPAHGGCPGARTPDEARTRGEALLAPGKAGAQLSQAALTKAAACFAADRALELRPGRPVCAVHERPGGSGDTAVPAALLRRERGRSRVPAGRARPRPSPGHRRGHQAGERPVPAGLQQRERRRLRELHRLLRRTEAISAEEHGHLQACVDTIRTSALPCRDLSDYLAPKVASSAATASGDPDARLTCSCTGDAAVSSAGFACRTRLFCSRRRRKRRLCNSSRQPAVLGRRMPVLTLIGMIGSAPSGPAILAGIAAAAAAAAAAGTPSPSTATT